MELAVKSEKPSPDGTPSSKQTFLEPSTSSSRQSGNYLTYVKKPGTYDKGREYEMLMCALYALKFGTSDDVLDFGLSTNDKDSGDFDDIKLEVTYKSGRKRIYLFQLKHKENEASIRDGNRNAIIAQKNVLIKYLNSILTKNNNKEAIFILYTNSPITITNDDISFLPPGMVVKDGCNMEYKDLLMNNKTSEMDHSNLQFEFGRINSTLNQDVLKRFYFFTNQKNVDEVQSLVKERLKALLGDDIYACYIHFVQDWCLGNFVLTKHDLITKLTELAFSPYIKVVSGTKCNEKSKQLEDAVMEHEITLIENCNEKIVENIWKAAEDHCYLPSDLEKFCLTNDPPDLQKTKVLWYMNLVPLIVNVDDTNNTTVLNVLKLIKTNLKNKKIILLGNVTKTDLYREWFVFENLSDLIKNCKNKQFCSNILLNFYVSLQGRQQVSLKSLIDFNERMATVIEAKELFIMSRAGFLQIGSQKMELPDSYISRTVSTITLDITKTLDECSQIKKCIMIINCNENFIETLQLKRPTVMELSHYLDEKEYQDLDNLILFSTKNKCTSIQFDQACVKADGHDVYVLQILDDKCGILLQRKGNQLSLDLIKYELQPVEENELFRYFNNTLNVICAPPGMGKSTFLANLYNNCSSEYWCIYINLINHNSLLKTYLDHDQLWKNLLALQDNNQNPLLTNIINVFVKSKKIQLFLDGLDEIDSKYIDILLNFIRHVASEKAIVWLSSRENLREKILKDRTFVLIEIQELNQKQQQKYVYERLENKYNHGEIEPIITAIFNSADVTNSQQMLGIPLQLYIITEILLNDKQFAELLYEQNRFVITKMYKEFFNGKKKFAYQKLGIDQQEYQLGIYFDDHLIQYELPALQACLDKTDFDKLNLDRSNSQLFIERMISQGDKFGIIKQITEDGHAIFVHQTYAEYFACVWLKRNLHKARLLRDELFLEKYENLKIIFDVMLGEESPLHLAIIYKNVQEIEKNTVDYDVKDCGGRHLLHLACSYGTKYSPYINYNSIRLNRRNRESQSYVNIIEILLSHCDNVLDCNDFFDLNCVDYSFRTHCLYPIEKMLEKHLLASKDYKMFDTYYKAETLVYHACQSGYPKILSHVLNHNSGILDSEIFGTVSLLNVVTIGSNGNTSIKEIATIKCELLSVPHSANRFIEIIQLLIKNGINVNQVDVSGVTPLQFACGESNVEIVKELLDKGANINAQNNQNMNALHYASQSGRQDIELIELLIKHGIRINTQDRSRRTALHIACKKNNVDIVKKLLDEGSDINALNNQNMDALQYACQSWRQNTELIELLIKGGIKFTARDKSGRTALHIACKQSNIEIVKKLLEKGADINAFDNQERNALHYACQSWRQTTDLIELLMRQGISVNARDKSGKVALHIVSKEGYVEIAKKLIDVGADVNAVSDEDLNALHYASQSKIQNTALIELLIKHGIRYNARDKFGKVALHNACKESNIQTVKKLLEKEADITVLDNQGTNVLHYASLSKRQNANIIELLINSGTDVNSRDTNEATALLNACRFGTVENVQTLINHNANLFVIDNERNNALHCASSTDEHSAQKINLLLNFQLDVDAQNIKGSTPLHFACLRNNLAVVKILLEHNADVTIMDKKNLDALHYARQRIRKKNTKIVNLLKEAALRFVQKN